MRTMNCPKSVTILAAVSILFLLAVLFLPTIVVALVLSNSFFIGAGSLWDCSKTASVLCLLLCVLLVLLPCISSDRRIWLLPLLLAVLAAAAFVFTIVYNLFFAEGVGFTVFALLSLAALTVSTLFEALAVKTHVRIASD
jgi:glucan phosphoethanolaminetransferase (alkaline phosphatase superfamily)